MMPASLAGAHVLDATISGFAGTMAVVETPDHQKILWPIKNLPDDAKEGTAVQLVLTTPLTRTADERRMARVMINTLLSSS